MGVLIPVGYGQCTFHFSQTGVVKEQTWSCGYNWSGSPDPSAHAEEISGFFTDPLAPFLAAHMLSEFKYLGTSTTEVDESGPLLGVFGTTVTGTRSGGTLPPNCSVLLSKATALGGRKNRGRIFSPAVNFDETLVSSGGVLESTGVGLYGGYWQNSFDSWIASDIPPVLLHSEAGTPTPITGVNMQSLIATQRRRLR